MSEPAQVTPEATAAPAEVPAAEPADLDAALIALADEVNAEAPEPEAEPEKEAPAKPEAEADDLFSDAALATPAGAKAARAKLQELRKAANDHYASLKKYERRVDKKQARLEQATQAFVADKRGHDLLLGNVRANLQGLHSGDPEQMILALGALTGQDGVKALEQLNSRLVHKGRVPLDPQVQALLDQQAAQIAELRGHVQSREEQAHVAGLQRQIDSHAQRIGQMITSDESLPHLAGFLRDDPAGTMQFLIGHIEETGGKVAASDLFRQIEAEIAKRVSAAPSGAGGTGSATKKPVPVTAQRTPGKSIGPSTAAAATQREPSEEEALAALAQDPFFLQLLNHTG